MTVLITGAARGLGHECARLFVQKGFRVISLDREKPAHPIAGVSYLRVDVTRVAEIQRALRNIRGPIDILLNNAGIMRRGTLFDVSEKDWDAVFAVNLKAPWLLVKEARPFLSPAPTIVNISSKHGVTLTADPAVYSLSKEALIAFSKILRLTEPFWRVKVACFGPIDTALHRTGRARAELARERRQKKVCTPGSAAEKVLALIESKKQTLLFNPETCAYRFTSSLADGR